MEKIWFRTNRKQGGVMKLAVPNKTLRRTGTGELIIDGAYHDAGACR
ncbi:hypothetical protein MRBBS_3800 [Marinobacter sp. BSs20148]|jgi:hypothetical protein|nr:hypothetical protein MRBBS_3800 [Marinobacter sp. BSs20148]